GEVVLARPEKLYGRVHGLGNPGRFHHIVVGQTPAKAAAAALHVDSDVLLGNAERLRHQRAAATRHLAIRPNFDLVALPMRGAILRLERSVRDKWIRVSPLHNLGRALQRSIRIAVLAKRLGGRLLRKLQGLLRESDTG